MIFPTESAEVVADRVVVGEVTAVSGLRGEIRIRSFTRPDTEILVFTPWFLIPPESGSPGRDAVRSGWIRPEWVEQGVRGPFRVVDGGKQGKQVVARLEGIEDREMARELVGLTIHVAAESLPVPGEGEYYWDQLIGLRVFNLQGEELGVVDHLLETGANDVLVIEPPRLDDAPGGGMDKGQSGQRLLPWVDSVVIEVDLAGGRIKVDWERDY